jgi:choline dehydrogenase-like flavoprotein
MKNLFIAGSSVFPTAGANFPTITLIALALRLADHLRDEMQGTNTRIRANSDPVKTAN